MKGWKSDMMKVYEWNIGMAATIPSNNGYTLLPWVIDEIIKEKPDCIILTEFVVSKGLDYYIDELEKNHYHWFISSVTKNNGILIALKACSFNFDNTFDYSAISVKTSNEVLVGNDLPDFYEIQVEWNSEALSIIGVRIKVDITGTNVAYKKNQFKALDDYLSKQNHNVLCIGDYNAFWGKNWSTIKNTTLGNTSKNGYTLHTPIYNKGDWYSFVQPNGNKNQLDHLITNIKDRTITVEYDWSFINPSRYTYNIKKDSANKPNGMPDHAMLKATIN